MKTTICHVTLHSAFDVRVFHKECVSLAQAGYDVHLVVPHTKDETVNEVRIHALKLPGSRTKRLVLAPWLALIEAIRVKPKPSIYHFHDPALLPAGILLRLLTGAAVICDQHEDTPAQILSKYWIPSPLRRALSLAMRTVEAFGLTGMGIIEASMIRGRYRQPKQSIRNLPIVPAISSRRRVEDFQGPPRFVYVGGVSEDRGIWNMLHLAKGLRDRGTNFRMSIAGPHWPPKLMDEVREFIDNHGLQEAVISSGRIPHEEAIQLVADSTVGLCLLNDIPNYRYALPTKILEYMTYGLPVVGSNLPCTVDYIRYCQAGIVVQPQNMDETISQVVDMINDPARLLRYSIAGQDKMVYELNWRKESALLRRFYRRILGELLEPDACWYHRK